MGNTKIKGIIFDYGGTIDSRGDHWSEVIWKAYQAENIKIEKETFRLAYVHAERELARVRHIMPQDNFLVLLQKKMEIEMAWLADNGFITTEEVSQKAQPVAMHCYNAAKQCVDEARPILEQLASHYPMVLVSNFYGNVEAVLTDFGIRHLFKKIIESAVVGIRKPDPRIFSLGVDALGMKPEETLVVGDSLKKDIFPAESIGCNVAWIKGKGWTPDEDAATHPSQIAGLKSLLNFDNLTY
ncbi:HAD family hydrolase [uncultured Muribaculum sp.]|uniref:HAD family hydrolase n=1 Tax=uncultured Muribaculum sp. TaxID=1918613 RepID=UPI00266FED77|nr:HAD family hydrolase [uncultured Muribaculum sp.]